MAPEAANKGPVALIKNGDIIDIDIEARSVNVELTDEQLDERRRELEAGDGYVAHRDRHVSQALKHTLLSPARPTRVQPVTRSLSTSSPVLPDSRLHS